jgi:hypothetical protein
MLTLVEYIKGLIAGDKLLKELKAVPVNSSDVEPRQLIDCLRA